MNAKASPNTRATVIAIIGLIALANLVFFAATFGRGTIPALAFLFVAYPGVIAAQGVLHGVWTVLGPGPSLKRLLMSVGVALLWYGTWPLGLWMVGDLRLTEDIRLAIVVPFCLPLVAIMIQAPVWTVAMWRGWQIVHGDAPIERQDFTTRDIMAAMLFIGLSIASVQFAAALLRDAVHVRSDDQLMRPLFVCSLVGMFVSAVTSIPIVWATLRPENVFRRVRLLVTIDLVGFVLVMGVLCAISGQLPYWWLLVQPLLMLVGFRVTVTGVMLAARACGFRVVTARDTGTDVDRASPFDEGAPGS